MLSIVKILGPILSNRVGGEDKFTERKFGDKDI